MDEWNNEYIKNAGRFQGMTDGLAKSKTRRFYKRPEFLVATFLIASAVVFACYYVPPPPETPEQVLLRKQEETRRLKLQNEQDERRAQKAEYNDYWCHKQLICNRYRSARQECAVAGNFENCLHVKIGADFSATGSCSEDGELLDTPIDMPNIAECLLFNGVRIFTGK
jgi:hypothetical protein